jgi:hypothetical protein
MGTVKREVPSQFPRLLGGYYHRGRFCQHIDARVIKTHVDKWNVTRVLVDNGSQAEILFLSTFKQMGFNKK